MTEKNNAPAKADEPKALQERDNAIELSELLSDMPELRAPEKLRVRHRNQLARLAMKLASANIHEAVEKNKDLTDEQVDIMLDVMADIDDFAESIAYDADAYADWSAGKELKHFMAIFDRYASAVGE